MTKLGLHIIIAFVFIASPIFSVQLKKVLILDIKNIDQDPKYQYLEPSLTEATRSKLKERFVFKEIQRIVWEKAAKENYIYFHDLHNDTAAMNLGLLTHQDVVIAGGYKIVLEKRESKKKKKKKKKKLVSLLQVKVRIYDIARREILAEIVEKTPIDNNLFGTVERIANNIAKEAQKVLPNKEEWKRMGIAGEEEPPVHNQVTILGGMGIAGVPHALTEVSSTSVLYPEVLPQNINLGLEYGRHDLFFKNAFMFARATYKFGSKPVAIQNTTKEVVLGQTQITGNLGLGYRLFLLPKLYSKIFVGGGYSVGTFTLDFSALKNKPINLDNNQPTSEEIYDSSAPFTSLDVRFGYEFTKDVSFETGANLNTYFYQGHVSQLVTAILGMGIHF